MTFNLRAPQQGAADRLANISTRGFVSTGQGQLIGGFIVSGGPKIVVIRTLGPSLTKSGVTPILADPAPQLFQGSTNFLTNDNWQTAPNAAGLSASGLAPQDPNEAGILVRLEPGVYTIVITGANNGTGIPLVEVYEIAHD